MTIKEICREFNINPISVKELGQGLINSSYVVTDSNYKRYLLQEINTHVFNNVDAVMHNIAVTTDHIRQKALNNGEDADKCTLYSLHTFSGENYIKVSDCNNNNHYYRMFNFIENATTYDNADEKILYECGVGFGKFQNQLADFPAENLFETIPNFHNTHARYINFTNLVFKLKNEGNVDKFREVYPEILTAIKYGLRYSNIITSALNAGEIPLRVVHNDTKLNNIMIDNSTGKAICAIDLDTVMPGSMLYDYGDAIRYATNTGFEDDINLDNVRIDMNKFRAFTEGYLSQIADCVTKKELEYMAIAPAVLSYELGLRFLTDYIDGNKYFKCDPSRPHHNLERARAQFKLMREFENHENEMQHIIQNSYSQINENE